MQSQKCIITKPCTDFVLQEIADQDELCKKICVDKRLKKHLDEVKGKLHVLNLHVDLNNYIFLIIFLFVHD